MNKDICRKISTIDYEYFLYNGSLKSQIKAYNWLHSFEEDAYLKECPDIEEDAIKVGSKRAGAEIVLREGEPAVLIRPAGCDEFHVISVNDFDKNYKIIRS